MQTIKTFLIVTVLSAVAYGVYLTVTAGPEPPPPSDVEPGWENGPQVELPSDLGVSGSNSAGGGNAPSFVPGAAAPSAPAASPSPLTESPQFVPTGTDPAASATPYQPQPVGAPANRYPSEGTGAAPADASASAAPAELAPPNSFAPQGAAGGNPVAFASTTSGATTGGAAEPLIPSVPAVPGGSAPFGAETPTGALPAAIETPTAHGAAPAATEAGSSFEADMVKVDQMSAAGQLGEALTLASQWYGDPRLTPEQEPVLMDKLNALAGTVIYSRGHYIEPAYVMQAGDQLERIGNQYRVPWELLAKINGISDPAKVQPGEQIKVLQGPFDAVVSLSKRQLTLFLDGSYAGRFTVGIGADNATPEGEFTVEEKTTNPTYYGREAVIQADDPNNPLGERWIGLGKHLGIHGTPDTSSIGQADSRGCIRLSPADVVDVYDILAPGSRVFIVP